MSRCDNLSEVRPSQGWTREHLLTSSPRQSDLWEVIYGMKIVYFETSRNAIAEHIGYI